MRTERLLATFDLELRITHFPLHPDTPDSGMTLAELFTGRDFDLDAAQAHLAQLMADEGLPYGERSHTYNSRLAQELAAWAQGQPGGQAIHDALFRAYFVDGINLAEVDRLVEIADSVGLSPDIAREILDRRSFRARVDADWLRSAELGVTGVPTFAINGKGMVGAQSYEALESFVLAAGAQRR